MPRQRIKVLFENFSENIFLTKKKKRESAFGYQKIENDFLFLEMGNKVF